MRVARLEQDERLLDLAQKPLGKVILFAVFALAFRVLYAGALWHGRNTADQILLVMLACGLAGRHRSTVLAATTLLLLWLAPGWYPAQWLMRLAQRETLPEEWVGLFRWAALGLVWLLSGLWLEACRRWPRSLPARRPVTCLLGFYAYCLVFADLRLLSGAAHLGLWAFIWALSAYLFYLAYALRHARGGNDLKSELANFHPFFSGVWIQIGLGAAHLRRVEAKSPLQLAACQLKGLKLLAHCVWMRILQLALNYLRIRAGLPEFDHILDQYLSQAQVFPRAVCWASLLISFFEGVVSAAVLGNLLVACARMAGYQLLQQVYHPLRATSLGDYWNRISYYYKQMVVELFFYPAYFGYFKRYPRLRQGFAVLMAAGVGNLIYHFRVVVGRACDLGLLEALRGMQSYALYCLILSLGLWLSQSAAAGPRPVIRPLGRARALLGIILFYSLLRIFDEPYSTHGPAQRLSFLAYLLFG